MDIQAFPEMLVQGQNWGGGQIICRALERWTGWWGEPVTRGVQASELLIDLRAEVAFPLPLPWNYLLDDIK